VTPRPRVLVADPIADDGVELLRRTCDVDVVTGQPADELLRRIPEYDALIVRSETKVRAEHIEAGRRLRVIGRAGVGVDNIDIEVATRQGVLVVNAPAGNTIAAAEHTLGMMLALARHLPQANRSLLEGRWERSKFVGFELRGKVLGVVGLGAIGSEVAKRAQGLEMEVLAHDPVVARERAEQINVELVSFDELCRRSDLITVHVPLTPATRHLFDAGRLNKCEPGVWLINVARGGIFDEAALLAGLESGRIAGAALDVFEEEPPRNMELLQHPNVVATPHLGASTAEAQMGVAYDIAVQVAAVLAGGAARWAVNAPTVLPEELQALQPYLVLAEKLGQLYAQAGPGGVQRLELDFTGALARHDVSFLTAEVLRGMLAEFTEARINVVNARILAEQRGIEVVEQRSSPGARAGAGADYPDLLTVRVGSGSGEWLAAATVLPQGPRIVQLGGFRVDVVPAGRFVITYHDDRPGVIGKVGTILGEANINIASLQLGRDTPRGRAVMIVAVDDEVPDDVRVRLAAIGGMSDLRYVVL
jgi:D-3-phosphoglycerate dehydrogenase